MQNAEHISIGKLGEDIASKFLKNKGFQIICRNFMKPYGEIDIIAKINGVTHFVEVKSVSRLTELTDADESRPEDNVHRDKLKRLSRIIEVYLSESEVENDWVFDVVTVNLNRATKVANVKHIQDIVIGS